MVKKDNGKVKKNNEEEKVMPKEGINQQVHSGDDKRGKAR